MISPIPTISNVYNPTGIPVGIPAVIPDIIPELPNDSIEIKTDKPRLVYGRNGSDLADIIKLYYTNRHKDTGNVSLWNEKYNMILKIYMSNSYRQNFLGNNTVLMLRKGEDLFGGVVAKVNKKTNSLYCNLLVIDAKYQRTQTGAQGIIMILNELYKIAKTEGVENIVWEAETNNKKAINLYNKFAEPAFSKDGKKLSYQICLDDLKIKLDRLNQLKTKLKK